MPVKLTIPTEVLGLPYADREQIMKSIGDTIGVPFPPIHTSHDEERGMWTPDEVPLIAELEDWFYGELTRPTVELYNLVMYALDLPTTVTPYSAVFKSFGDGFTDWLSKSDQNSRGFKLQDLVRMNKKSREKLMRYVADGGVYSVEELQRMRSFISANMPDYRPLLEAYAVRGLLIGKVKQVADENNLRLLGTLLSNLPVALEQVRLHPTPVTLTDQRGEHRVLELPPLSDAEVMAVQYAEQHAAHYVTGMSDDVKQDILQAVVSSRRNRLSPQELQQRLLDDLGEHNRDWRRIALTETTDVMAQGYLASLQPGDYVMGQGAANACKHCKRLIIGKSYRISEGPGDVASEVWIGKTNVGNKVKDYVPAIPLHPHCRCRWVKVSQFQSVDEQGKLRIKPLEELIEEYKQRGLVHSDYTMDEGAPVVQKSMELPDMKARAPVTTRKVAPVPVHVSTASEVKDAADSSSYIDLYHKTPLRKLASIMGGGLIPNYGKPTNGFNPAYNAVYFHTSLENARDYDVPETSAILRVRVPITEETTARLRPDEDTFHSNVADAIRAGESVAFMGLVPPALVEVAELQTKKREETT